MRVGIKGFLKLSQSLSWPPQRKLAVAHGSCPTWKYPGVQCPGAGEGTRWALGVPEHGMSLLLHA